MGTRDWIVADACKIFAKQFKTHKKADSYSSHTPNLKMKFSAKFLLVAVAAIFVSSPAFAAESNETMAANYTSANYTSTNATDDGSSHDSHSSSDDHHSSSDDSSPASQFGAYAFATAAVGAGASYLMM